MRVFTVILILCLAGCAKPPVPGGTHYARTDDLGEYDGLYLFTHAPDGALWRTHYPGSNGEKIDPAGPWEPEEPKQIGTWIEKGDKLIWRLNADGDPTTIYLKNDDGEYVEQDGTYYVPVRLKTVEFKGRLPRVDE